MRVRNRWMRVTGRGTPGIPAESKAVFAAVAREMVGGSVPDMSDDQVFEGMMELCREGLVEMELRVTDEGIEVRYAVIPYGWPAPLSRHYASRRTAWNERGKHLIV